jgi:hypothetical protein
MSLYQIHTVYHRIQKSKAVTAQLLSIRVGLWPLACCNCGFDSLQGNGFLFLVSVVFCQVEVSATVSSLVQLCRVWCSIIECGIEIWTRKRPGPLGNVKPQKNTGV